MTPVLEIFGVTSDNNQLPLEVRSRQVPFQGHTANVVTLRDLTERKQVEAQQQQVAALKERERIGRDLHDNLGQVMGYMSLQAQVVRNLLEQAKVEQAQAVLNQLASAAQEAHEDIRHFLLDIRTQATNRPLNFEQELRLYFDQVYQRYGLVVDLSLPANLPANLLSIEADAQLLRIIQEAITNICKHAETNHARLLFVLHPNELEVMVSDEGRGIDKTNDEIVRPTLLTSVCKLCVNGQKGSVVDWTYAPRQAEELRYSYICPVRLSS